MAESLLSASWLGFYNLKLAQSQVGTLTGHAFRRPHALRYSYCPQVCYRSDQCSSHEENTTVDASTPQGTGSTFMDTIKKSWLRENFNKESVSSEERAALHEAKMKEFLGSGRDGFHNRLLEEEWAPWARKVQYVDSRDPDFWFDDGGSNFCRKYFTESYAVPTLRVLEYMVSKAPEGRIAEIGSGLGYWASLLNSLGANVVAVDNFAELKETIKPVVETVRMDGPEFMKQGGADGRALFLCWPPMKPLPKNLDDPNEERYCFAEACLELYKGHTVFFVGESPGCTYDVAEWMENHRDMGWRLEIEIEIPCWAGLHDSFMCFMKHQKS